MPPKIVVGVLCGRGETEEALQVLQRVSEDKRVDTILPLFPAAPSKCLGKYVFYPPAADNRRGAARTELLKILSRLQADYFVLLDDDTLPDPDYFDELSEASVPEGPYLITGQLRNADGRRSWDVCSFQEDARPVVVPYSFINHPTWSKDLYFSGPQHIFNRAGVALAAKVGYPDLEYGEDTHFCNGFKKLGGGLVFLPSLKAQLLHQHEPPNEPLVWT
jgi:hypothetical protein